jgi:hypothetical protein
MKNVVSVFLVVVLAGFVFGQDLSPAIHPQPASAGFSLHKPASNWRQFDNHSGLMQFHAGSNFFGSSLAYFTRGESKLLYGVNLNVFSVSASDDYLTSPFWFTLKFRLSDRSSSNFSPYIITGLGPTLALRFNNGSNFISALSEFNTVWGGGGYLGAGFDYLWAGEWAISADIRYNVIRFDNPVGLNRDYSGFSFAVGFLRAFGL